MAVALAPDERTNDNEEVMDWPYRFEVVEVSSFFIDHAYQRNLTTLAVEIEEGFNPALVGTLICSERSNGKIAVVDGQTRFTGAKEAGILELPALVYSNMTRQDEAALFSLLQRKRRNMMTHERFKAALVAKEPEAMAINKILKQFGYEVGPRGGASSNTVQAVAAMESIFRKVDGPDLLKRVVRVIDRAWGGPDADMREAFGADMIRGIGRLLYKSESIEDDRLVDRLSKVSPAKLRMSAAYLREGKGGGGHVSGFMAEAILGVYSKRS